MLPRVMRKTWRGTRPVIVVEHSSEALPAPNRPARQFVSSANWQDRRERIVEEQALTPFKVTNGQSPKPYRLSLKDYLARRRRPRHPTRSPRPDRGSSYGLQKAFWGEGATALSHATRRQLRGGVNKRNARQESKLPLEVAQSAGRLVSG